MQLRLSLTLISLSLLITTGVSAVGPGVPPPGGYTGGLFSVYFQNIVGVTGGTGLCPPGQGIVGFNTGSSNYGAPICQSVSLSPGILGQTLVYNGSNWIATSNVFHSGANVGIGTTTPQAKLDINGSIRINDGSQGSGKVLTSNAAGLAVWGSAPAPCTPGGTGNQNVCYGIGALQSNTSGFQNTAHGYMALYANTIGGNNTAVGNTALINNISGGNNSAFGLNSLYSNTSGSNNTANGVSALFSNTTGIYNTAVGISSLQANTTGNYNTAHGAEALFRNTTGIQNTAIGMRALQFTTVGSSNTANGMSSMWSNVSGQNNTAMGVSSLEWSTSGNNNVAIGTWALSWNTIGSQNTGIGDNALVYNTTGNNNTAIGRSAGNNLSSGNNNIAIGVNTNFASATGSNQLNIGNWIYGSGGNIGIGNSNPTSALSVSGAITANTYYFNTTSSGAGAGTGADTNYTWTWIGANIANLNTGNVGIGTMTPSQKLDINGDIIGGTFRSRGSNGWFSETYGGGIYMGDSTYLRIVGDKTLWTANGLLGSQGGLTVGYWGATSPSGGAIIAGNVGVGTSSPSARLDVAGEIKIGNSGTSCNASAEGQMRYNSGSKIMEFCNGTTWASAGGGSSVPTGAIMAFYLASCPTGWIPANGTSGTPDLRGEFVRGLDSGRSVDNGRALGSFQRGSLVMNIVNNSDARMFNLVHMGDNRLGYDPAITDSTKSYYWAQAGSSISGPWGVGSIDPNYVQMTRPRNVALLYCMKQ